MTLPVGKGSAVSFAATAADLEVLCVGIDASAR